MDLDQRETGAVYVKERKFAKYINKSHLRYVRNATLNYSQVANIVRFLGNEDNYGYLGSCPIADIEVIS